MAPKKTIYTCRYVDKDDMSALMFISSKSSVCYDRAVKVMSVDDYYNLDVDKIMAKREDLIKRIQNYEVEECKDCPLYYKKEVEDDSVSNKISWLNIASFETCTLKCKYCYFTPEQLDSKLDEKRRYLLPIIKQFHDKNALADNVCIAIAGGELGLFKDLPETLEFVRDNYKSPRFNFQSNSTCTKTIQKMIPVLKECKNFTFKNLYTSFDSGTPETFTNVRGLNMFDAVVSNVKYMAESDAFTHIQLKYILLNDPAFSNYMDNDIYGFCKIVEEIKSVIKNTHLSVAIDFDLKQKQNHRPKVLIKAAAKIVEYCLKNDVDYVISNCNFCTAEDRRKIEKNAKKSIILKWILFKKKFTKAMQLYRFFQQ